MSSTKMSQSGNSSLDPDPDTCCCLYESSSTSSSSSSVLAVHYEDSEKPSGTSQGGGSASGNVEFAYEQKPCECPDNTSESVTLKYVVSTLEGVQGAMCKINRKMSQTGRAVAQVARRLRSQGQKVQKLQSRLRAVEPRLNLRVNQQHQRHQQHVFALCDGGPCTPPQCSGHCFHPVLDMRASCPACPQPCVDPRAAHSAAKCRERRRSPSRSRPHAPRHQRLPYLATHATLNSRRSCAAVPPPCVVQRPSAAKGMACVPVTSSPTCAWAQPGAQCAQGGGGGGGGGAGGGGGYCCSASCDDAHFHSPLARRLFKMAHDGRAEDVWHLLAAGADVNCLNSSKWTPLHRAAAQGHVCVVAMLLEWGARVDAQTAYGHSPLHLAAAHDCSGRCAEVLLCAGADVNCTTRSRQTPLHLAANSGNAASLQVLLRAGARTGVCDDTGRTPLDVAKGSCRRLLRGCSRRPHKSASCYIDALYVC